MSSVLIGIDPGVQTGFAAWSCERKAFECIETLTILGAIDRVDEIRRAGRLLELRFEDAHQRRWFGNKGREALQGAGSIKRDCSIWREYCEKCGIRFHAVPPQAGATKWDATRFARLTGWKSRTSEHARDAALLVFGVTGIQR